MCAAQCLLTSSPNEACVSFRVTRALRMKLRSTLVDLGEIFGRKLQCRAAQVLVEALELGRAGDRNDPRLLREQPGERDLCWRGALSRRDRAEQLDEDTVRLA